MMDLWSNVPTPGTEIEKMQISRFFVLYKNRTAMRWFMLFFIILKMFLNATIKIYIKQDKSLYYLVSSSILFEKYFDLCHASSLLELWIVRSGILVLFKCPTLPLPYVQMHDPRDTSWCQILIPAGMKAGQIPRGCLRGGGMFKLRFDRCITCTCSVDQVIICLFLKSIRSLPFKNTL